MMHVASTWHAAPRALRVGVQRLGARSTIVRNLLSLETLAAVDVLIVDKTGHAPRHATPRHTLPHHARPNRRMKSRASISSAPRGIAQRCLPAYPQGPEWAALWRRRKAHGPARSLACSNFPSQ